MTLDEQIKKLQERFERLEEAKGKEKGITDLLKAKEFRLVDEDGKGRISLCLDEDNPELVFSDKDGELLL